MVRAMIGLAILACFLKDELYFQGQGLVRILCAFLLVFALFRYCPLYGILGLSTDRRLDQSA